MVKEALKQQLHTTVNGVIISDKIFKRFLKTAFVKPLT